ncbi:MAG: hypothetical protein KGO49_15180, partial [Gammaproteobacteria bacterium]|nr:hypothetical protein [Gammaproteobacteria bacterium]
MGLGFNGAENLILLVSEIMDERDIIKPRSRIVATFFGILGLLLSLLAVLAWRVLPLGSSGLLFEFILGSLGGWCFYRTWRYMKVGSAPELLDVKQQPSKNVASILYVLGWLFFVFGFGFALEPSASSTMFIYVTGIYMFFSISMGC